MTVGRLAQATLRFSFVVLYHGELPNPAGSAIILVWTKQTSSPIPTWPTFRILCLTQCSPLLIVLIGSAIVTKSMQPTTWLISLLMLTLLSTENNYGWHFLRHYKPTKFTFTLQTSKYWSLWCSELPTENFTTSPTNLPRTKQRNGCNVKSVGVKNTATN